MTEVLERWRWYVVALLAVPMLVGVGMLLEEELERWHCAHPHGYSA